MDNISISIPNELGALRAAAAFFLQLREDAIAKFEEESKEAPSGVDYKVAYERKCEVLDQLVRERQENKATPQVAESIPEPAAIFAAPAIVGDGNEPEVVIPTCDAPIVPPPPTVPPAGVTLDSAGIPWDARIHSSSCAFVADGTWRLRRNLDPNVLAAVKAELGQAMGAPAAPALPPAPIAPVPPPPFAPTAPQALTFPSLLQKITAAGITKEQATAAAIKIGLPSFALVATRPDLLPAMAAELGVA